MAIAINIMILLCVSLTEALTVYGFIGLLKKYKKDRVSLLIFGITLLVFQIAVLLILVSMIFFHVSIV